MTHFIRDQVLPGCFCGVLRIAWNTLTQGPCHRRGEIPEGLVLPAKRGNPRSRRLYEPTERKRGHGLIRATEPWSEEEKLSGRPERCHGSSLN